MNPEQHDALLRSADWLAERDLPVALTLTETLEPASGPEAIIFPPTYARRGGDHPYAITTIRSDVPPEEAAKKGVEANICDLDTVGSQANRMEPAFKPDPKRSDNPLASLVPQIVIKAAKPSEPGASVHASLLDAGHRIADGAVRFVGGLVEEANAAIRALRLEANAGPLARLAPTSLVFGFWDSRASQYKFPRIVSSTIRATNVAVLKRSAQFDPVLDPAELGLKGPVTADPALAPILALEPAAPAAKPGEGEGKLSELGMDSAPAVDTHGGVRVFGRIVRRTEINLVALRALAIVKDGAVDEAESLKLRRYILGLALVAARAQGAYNLRAGCLLVGAESTPPEAATVAPSGKREAFAWDFRETLGFAKAAAEAFGIYSERPAIREFDFQTAKVTDALKTTKGAVKAAKKAKA